MTSDDNTQIEKVSASLVKTVTSEDPPNVAILCIIYCEPRFESYTGNVTLVVNYFVLVHDIRVAIVALILKNFSHGKNM